MRISTFMLFFLPFVAISAQNATIEIHTQNVWPAGKDVPVTVEITKGNAENFARFYQTIPVGFTVISDDSTRAGADYFWDNNELNIVWTNLPDQAIIRLYYLLRPNSLLSGSFRLGGKFDYIVNEKERISVSATSKLIKLDKDVSDKTLNITGSVESNSDEFATKGSTHQAQTMNVSNNIVDFRVQISISSLKLNQKELEKKIKCKLKHNITVVKTGSIYKYQSGSFSEYNEALKYLKSLKSKGLKDVFVVAFKNKVQISINEAEDSIKN